ncbi:hypothetical protein DXG01_004449 [Tephrocybe rancida]|nr:hypothetical protein DXG01_004449 [Tephrocybe rancida]
MFVQRIRCAGLVLTVELIPTGEAARTGCNICSSMLRVFTQLRIPYRDQGKVSCSIEDTNKYLYSILENDDGRVTMTFCNSCHRMHTFEYFDVDPDTKTSSVLGYPGIRDLAQFIIAIDRIYRFRAHCEREQRHLTGNVDEEDDSELDIEEELHLEESLEIGVRFELKVEHSTPDDDIDM